jgi:hypothetical protein
MHFWTVTHCQAGGSHVGGRQVKSRRRGNINMVLFSFSYCRTVLSNLRKKERFAVPVANQKYASIHVSFVRLTPFSVIYVIFM